MEIKKIRPSFFDESASPNGEEMLSEFLQEIEKGKFFLNNRYFYMCGHMYFFGENR